MSFEYDKTFEVEHGFTIEGQAGMFSGYGTPVDPASEGSIYLDTQNHLTYRMVSSAWGLSNASMHEATQEPTGFARGISTTLGDISFVNGTRTFTIEPQSGEDYFSFWIKGREWRKESSEDLIITDVQGIHAIYYNSSGVLSEIANPTDSDIDDLIRNNALVTLIYWSVADSEQLYFGEERHGITMDGVTHGYLHFTEGLKYLSGLALGNFSINQSGDLSAHAQFSVALGAVTDEDIYLAIDAVTSATGLPIYYRDGANGYWKREIESGFSVTNFGSGRLNYNEDTGSTWQTTEVTNNDFVLCHIFATTNIEYPMIAVMGQEEYGNARSARAGANEEIANLLLGDLPTPEITPVATIIFQTSNGYANAVQGRTRTTDEGENYIDWRTAKIQRTSAAGSHGSLSGLENDDHSQYLNLDGARDMNTGYVPANDMSVVTKKYLEDNPALPKDIVETGETYTIAENEHHIVVSKMTVNGTININGTLGVL